MQRIRGFFTKWRMRVIIKTLNDRLQSGMKPDALSFIKTLEATSMMMHGAKRDAEVVLQCSRAELTAFIQYMTQLHDHKSTQLTIARAGLATVLQAEEDALGAPRKAYLLRESARTIMKDGVSQIRLLSAAAGKFRKQPTLRRRKK